MSFLHKESLQTLIRCKLSRLSLCPRTSRSFGLSLGCRLTTDDLFLSSLQAVVNPLFALTRKDVLFEWTKACSDAFGRLQQLLTQASLLGFPDFSREFILETNASGDGLGAVLAQKLSEGVVHPLAYASRSLQPHEKNYGVTELEGPGGSMGCQTLSSLPLWSPYQGLHGH